MNLPGSSSCQFLHYPDYSLGGGTPESFILSKPGFNFSTRHRKCQAKIQVISEESCFTADTVVRRKVKKNILVTDFLKLASIR